MLYQSQHLNSDTFGSNHNLVNKLSEKHSIVMQSKEDFTLDGGSNKNRESKEIMAIRDSKESKHILAPNPLQGDKSPKSKYLMPNDKKKHISGSSNIFGNKND